MLNWFFGCLAGVVLSFFLSKLGEQVEWFQIAIWMLLFIIALELGDIKKALKKGN